MSVSNPFFTPGNIFCKTVSDQLTQPSIMFFCAILGFELDDGILVVVARSSGGAMIHWSNREFIMKYLKLE
jgi:hypothetical protein